ncbi:Uncharacterized membrane protein YczE [Anaerobranca californiensis DSM 14826]|jgi:uncharacterized membrane protein YczE|uniref:Uncharacterized membrane protein YczE n=1 Tax=Anaerobranca californiensis DSM 14826 TaxID=1120989 RepID=A0A1M6NS03_9FIRM|nr:hypothetical protein [Anaerobranca californiensis]SHJ98511.1 Uncharacterized membrane protein YczE [Anaerobranca californiensis DSM 14826]
MLKSNKNTLSKLPTLFFGFALCSLGITMMYKVRDLGLGPWDVLHTGIMNYLPLTFGQVSQLMGFVIILFSLFLGVAPGIGTVLNMIFIGIFIDFFNSIPLLFTPQTYIGKLLMLILGVWVLSIGIYFYLKCGLGAGPRDGLMLGLMKKTNLPVGKIKTFMEISVVIIGALLGGKVGIGTIIVALMLGYSLQVVFTLGKYQGNNIVHRTLKDEFLSLKNRNKGKINSNNFSV